MHSHRVSDVFRNSLISFYQRCGWHHRRIFKASLLLRSHYRSGGRRSNCSWAAPKGSAVARDWLSRHCRYSFTDFELLCRCLGRLFCINVGGLVSARFKHATIVFPLFLNLAIIFVLPHLLLILRILSRSGQLWVKRGHLLFCEFSKFFTVFHLKLFGALFAVLEWWSQFVTCGLFDDFRRELLRVLFNVTIHSFIAAI